MHPVRGISQNTSKVGWKLTAQLEIPDNLPDFTA